MGMEAFNRPVVAPAVVAGGSTDTTPTRGWLIGDFVQANPIVASSAIQTITGATGATSTAAALTPIAVATQFAFITSSGSGAGWECSITAGRTVGSRLTIVADTRSTAPITVLLESTATTFLGSTANALTFSTDSSGEGVQLLKVSTSQWGVVSRDAAKVTMAASTGTV